MLHRKFSSTTVRKNSLCHPASALWGKLTVIQGSRGRHTPTHSCRKSLWGADYSWQGGGRRAGRDPSSAFTEIMRSRFLKAHHKLSSIWEPLFLAGPTQRLQTRVKQRWAGGADRNLRKMVRFVLLSQNYILSQLTVCLSFLGKKI